MSGGTKYYDLDARLSDSERPRIKFRGDEYFVDDLSAKDILLFTRRVQTKQDILAQKEEMFEEEIQERIAHDENVDVEEIERQREALADQMQNIFAEAAKTVFAKIKKDEDGNDIVEDGKVQVEEMPDEVADSLSAREWAMLQETLAEINGAIPLEDAEGN